MTTYSPVNVDVSYRIDKIFLGIGFPVVATKVSGEITQNWNVLEKRVSLLNIYAHNPVVVPTWVRIMPWYSSAGTLPVRVVPCS